MLYQRICFFYKSFVLLPLLVCLISCGGADDYDDEYYEDEYEEEEFELGNWNQYRGIFQTAAVSVATSQHFQADDNTIEFVKAIDKKIRRIEIKLFVWRWQSNGESLNYITGYFDDSSFDTVLKENEELTLDAAIRAISKDDYDALGNDGENIFWSVSNDVYIPYIEYLPERLESSTAVVSDVVDLSNYTDTGNCELFWENGKRKGFKTQEWIDRVKSFRQLIDENDIATFTTKLNELDQQMCQSEYFDYLYSHLYRHEETHSSADSRAQFLEIMLSVGGQDALTQREYDEGNICDALMTSIFIPSNGRRKALLTDENSSVEFVHALLEQANFSDKPCNLWEVAERLAPFNRLDLVEKIISIESLNSSDEINDGYYTALEAFTSYARNGHYESSKALLEAVKQPFFLDEVLSSISAGGNQQLLDDVLAKGIEFEDDDIEHVCKRSLQAAVETGEVSVVEKLISLGCELPKEKYEIQDLLEALIKIRPEKKHLEIYSALTAIGLDTDQLQAKTAMKLARTLVRTQVVAEELRSSYELSDQQLTALQLDYQAFTEKFLAQLIPVMGSVDFRDHDETLVMTAVEKSNTHAVKTLLEYKPDLSLKNDANHSALKLAQRSVLDKHRSRTRVFGENVIDSFNIIKKRREKSLEIVRMLGGNTSVFDVYVY